MKDLEVEMDIASFLTGIVFGLFIELCLRAFLCV